MAYGILSVTPPLVAILLAIVFRRVVLALLVAVFLAVALITCYDPDAGQVNLARLTHVPKAMLIDHLWYALAEGHRMDLFQAATSSLQGDWQEARSSLEGFFRSDHLRVFYFTRIRVIACDESDC